MDASILLVGDRDFLSAHLQLVRSLITCTVETAPIFDALSLVQAQQPDILLLQSAQDGSLELCQHIRAQSRLTWIYCILIERRLSDSVESGYTALVESSKTPVEIEIQGLNAGADAVIWQESSFTEDIATTEGGESSFQSSPDYSARLHAQIQAGLRRVQNHRELMRTNDLLSTIALIDPLTELNNRRAFEWELPRQIKNARTSQAPLSLLVLDVDFFKTINDTYGHLVGDRALHLLSARFKHNLRFCDIPFRYGGEEFVVILSGTDARNAFLVAQRLCRAIAKQPFTINENLELKITISAGTATLTDSDDERGINLLNRADQNLLKAKGQGRNRVVGYSDDGSSAHPDPSAPAKSQKPINCNCCDSVS